MVRRRRTHKSVKHLFKKKSACKRGKPKRTTCRKVRGGWKRYRVKR